MKINKFVEEYIELYEIGKTKLNKERVQLFSYLKKHIFSRNDLYFDETQINQCIGFMEKYYFPLQPFQKFIIPFFFLVNEKTGRLHYRRYLIMMGRGGGKNGLISALSNYLNSELHGINEYNISIIANSEDQAKTSFEEVYNVIDSSVRLKKSFQHGKSIITNRKTKSTLRFRTSNAETKDGGREGAIIFDEIHQYEDRKTVNVFKSGLGKKKHPREIYIGTDGYLREGFLDGMKEQAAAVLSGNKPDSNLFPFICKLDDAEQVDDSDTWELANPMFSLPRSEYAQNLFETVYEEFEDLIEDPSGREEFMTKRMNLPEVDLAKSVASWDEIMSTGFNFHEFKESETLSDVAVQYGVSINDIMKWNKLTSPFGIEAGTKIMTERTIPDLEHRTAVGALDFASIRDFAAVGLLFKVEDDYIWKTHSFVRKEFLDQVKLKAPIHEWEEQGLLTIVDEPVISIKHVVNWFVEMREKYGVNTIVADTFRLDLVKTALEDEGFTLLYIRNPKAIHSLLAPRVETLFANKNIIFGDNQLMRWYTNNVFVKIKKDGNKEYLKKDEFRRKTDGFQAFIHALWQADNILEEDLDFFLTDIKF